MNRSLFRRAAAASVLTVALAASAFAGGQKEWTAPSTSQPSAASGGSASGASTSLTEARRSGRPAGATAVAVTAISGQISYVNRTVPILTSGSDQYALLIPPIGDISSVIREGQTISVKGYVVDGQQGVGPTRFLKVADGTKFFHVITVTVDGKEYAFEPSPTMFRQPIRARSGVFQGPMLAPFGGPAGFGSSGSGAAPHVDGSGAGPNQ